MKIHNWCRKLFAALVAGGLMTSGTASAASLGADLVINGDFEDVDLASTGDYNGPRILNWSGTAAFAYSHDGSSSNAGIVADYAEGADPANAGHWYFTSNNATPDIDGPGEFFQDIDVSAGDTGLAIAAGTAAYRLSAEMSSYDVDDDFGNVQLDFLDGSAASLGFALLSDGDPGDNNVWSANLLVGGLPIGTAAVRLSLFGTPVDFGPDGYLDNVSFSISVVPEPSTVALVSLGLAAAGSGVRRRRDDS